MDFNAVLHQKNYAASIGTSPGCVNAKLPRYQMSILY